MASNMFSVHNDLELIYGNDSDFLGSESSGEEGEEVSVFPPWVGLKQ